MGQSREIKMSLPKNLKLTDLILKEPVDFKAMGQDDQIKYQRHRRRTSYTGGESVEFSVNNSKRKINPENLTREDIKFLKQMSKDDLREALTLIQRIRRGRMLKRIKSKIQRGARLARRRVASLATLTKRARRAARNLIIQKITKGVSKGDLPFARRQELERRLEKPAISRRLATIAKRLIPQMRKAEVQRKQAARAK
tara:strand:- start:1174 stop:1767 length:594 start_codon:yes stop_codon:yes gene_type:complete